MPCVHYLAGKLTPDEATNLAQIAVGLCRAEREPRLWMPSARGNESA
jgi:hypothetical protein